MNIQQYIKALDADYAAGKATEHTYRHALRALLAEAAPDVQVTNEPKQIECGAPDFLLARGEVPLGYVETKSVGKNLDDKSFRAQFKRYTDALDNLIITDYLEFRFFRGGEKVAAVRVGEIRGGRVRPRQGEFEALENLLANFTAHDGIAISNSDELAAHMAVKARLLAAAVADSLLQDEKDNGRTEGNGELHDQLQAFRKHLIHDIRPAEFADIYAQTIAYGLFAARLHDDNPGAFTRIRAGSLIPENNPFLRKFFQHIAAHDLDKRIRWVVDALADLFRIAAVEELMAQYTKGGADPFLHFYETFLGAYNPKLRKSRGVYYTPEPIVDFMVRAVDEILRGEFKLRDGLAATDKTRIETKTGETKLHKVQILDPGTGTGTFLASIVRHIHKKYFARQQGVWQSYAREDLAPRLNGFEILMAPYVMAHIKMNMVLRETGCELGRQRAHVFLTNTLEEHHPDTKTLFARWLSDEANQANFIKRDTPVMVVIGNPPYAVSSSNRGPWIQNLLGEYKKGLKEKKLNLDDDYIKFIRYGEHVVQKTGEGVLAYITNNSFLEGITHRQMRKTLLETFDKIYILDLHGDAGKKETAPDGSADKNVFDIMQGVSINLLVKTRKKGAGALARVFHADLYGVREAKYEFLQSKNLASVGYKKLNPVAPQFFFTPKDFSAQKEYEKGFSLQSLFGNYNSGIQTKCDELSVKFSQTELDAVINDFLKLEVGELQRKYPDKRDSSGWNFRAAKKSLMAKEFKFANMLYRPFDIRRTVDTKSSSGFIGRPRKKTMRHMLAGENVGIGFMRQVFFGGEYSHVFVSKHIIEERTFYSRRGATSFAPLYLYPETAQKDLDEKSARKPNLDSEIVKAVAAALNLRFAPEKETGNKTFAPIDLLDYIYAVLHAPSYRERYNEFLKIDYPRVPYPQNAAQFRKLAKLGGKLRALHLMEPAPKLITTYKVAGDNAIDSRVVRRDFYKITDAKKRLGNVHINAKQYFGNVPEIAWSLYIGGYQPAQKYLKDRKERRLSAGEIGHYQHIIAALAGTGQLMKEIDAVWTRAN
ncbi:MAG: N-6 DNA methylase [Gammaproteobacteria bacterium]|nr:N-6 DNA methylase [Gammaproteobacteria bacterium]